MPHRLLTGCMLNIQWHPLKALWNSASVQIFTLGLPGLDHNNSQPSSHPPVSQASQESVVSKRLFEAAPLLEPWPVSCLALQRDSSSMKQEQERSEIHKKREVRRGAYLLSIMLFQSHAAEFVKSHLFVEDTDRASSHILIHSKNKTMTIWETRGGGSRRKKWWRVYIQREKRDTEIKVRDGRQALK